MPAAFPKTPRNRLHRLAKNGAYDQETVYAILDAAPICHVGFVQEGEPYVIPVIHARLGDRLVLHGAKASRLLKHAASGQPLCVTATILDGVVLARSVFNHSMNYRSVVIFGKGTLVTDPAEKLHALRAVSEHLLPGRWEDARPPSPKEFNATSVVSITIESASAKVHSGPPEDDPEDYSLPYWAGELPMVHAYLPPVPDPRLDPNTPLPEYIAEFLKRQS
jgi:hypothetical protein